MNIETHWNISYMKMSDDNANNIYNIHNIHMLNENASNGRQKNRGKRRGVLCEWNTLRNENRIELHGLQTKIGW